jgi:hypothetical protein
MSLGGVVEQSGDSSDQVISHRQYTRRASRLALAKGSVAIGGWQPTKTGLGYIYQELILVAFFRLAKNIYIL